MVHKSSLIPGFSRFIDENILANYPPTSLKRILMAGAVSLYLKHSEGTIEALTSSPLINGLGVVKDGGMIDIDTLRDVLKYQVSRVGFVRVTPPIIGDIDFTNDDIDALYKFIVEANTQQVTTPAPQSSTTNNSLGVY